MNKLEVINNLNEKYVSLSEEEQMKQVIRSSYLRSKTF